MNKKFGNLDFEILFDEAIKICHEGFEISHELNQTLKYHQETLIDQDSSENFYIDGNPVSVGDVVKGKSLENTFPYCKKWTKYFYEGDIAEAISKATKNILTNEDIKNFKSNGSHH